MTGAPGTSPATSSPPEVCASASSRTSSSATARMSQCGATHARFRRLPPGRWPARSASRAPSISGTAAWSITAVTPLARASLYAWPSRPNPVTSVAHRTPAASAARLAAAFSVVITSIAAMLTCPVALCQAFRTPEPSGLVSVSGSPGTPASRRSSRPGSAMPVGAEQVTRPAEQVQRHQRLPAHGVDIGQRVGRGDPAERPGIVHHRGEEIRGRHDRPARAEPHHRGVVAVLDSDQQVARAVLGHEPGNGLLKLPRRDLARAAAAPGEPGQPVSGHPSHAGHRTARRSPSLAGRAVAGRGGRRPRQERGRSSVGRAGVRVPGGPPGLQNRWTARDVVGGFDSRPPPLGPGGAPQGRTGGSGRPVIVGAAMHVIATAGHVDHGKSTLVRALTGMEPDRWESERRRGMTIDLGFAWTSLQSGGPVAFVDVPGHERFIPNMLAGAGSVPAVMFVVAADEGWMPQSAEHLAAIDAFGVRHGVLAISRSDLADPGSAMREAQRHLSGTSLGSGAAGPEAVAVSALTGRGLPDLVAALDRLVARLPAADPDGDVRLWLDRAFVIKGSGTVVTGTLQAGTIRAGDELTLTPSQRRVRVRGMQSLGTPVTQASGVARVALNLRGVGATDLRRGMALVTEGRWTLTGVIDVRVLPPPSHPAGAAALPARVTLHVGTARVAAGLRVLGERIARLTLAHPLPLHVGDRLLLRDPGARAARAAASGPGGPAMVAAAVLDVTPPPLRGSGAAARAAKDLASWPDAPAISHLLARHPVLRARTAEAMGLRGLPEPVAGDWLVDPAHWRRLRGLLAEAVAADAARDPLAPGLAVDA